MWWCGDGGGGWEIIRLEKLLIAVNLKRIFKERKVNLIYVEY